jgi:ankyrin repeat protein
MSGGCVNVGPLPEPPKRFPVYERARFPTVSDDPTPLVRAIWEGEPAKVEALVKAGSDPDARWGSGDRFALSEVIVPHNFGPPRHRDEIVRLLLAHDADPDQRFCPFESRAGIEPTSTHDGVPPCSNSSGFTPLMAAARMDQWDVVYRLLDAGAKPLELNWFKSTALDYAQGDYAFRLLLTAAFPGANAEERAAGELLRRLRLGPEDLLEALQYGQVSTYYGTELSYGRLRLLLFALGDIDAGIDRRQAVMTKLLGAAITNGSRGESAALLVTAGASPTYRYCPSTTLGRRSDLKCTPETGTTLLMFAASCGAATLERAAARIVDASLVDWEGRTAGDYRRSRPISFCGSATPW